MIQTVCECRYVFENWTVIIKGRLQCFFCLVPLLPLSTTHANAAVQDHNASKKHTLKPYQRIQINTVDGSWRQKMRQWFHETSSALTTENSFSSTLAVWRQTRVWCWKLSGTLTSLQFKQAERDKSNMTNFTTEQNYPIKVSRDPVLSQGLINNFKKITDPICCMLWN